MFFFFYSMYFFYIESNFEVYFVYDFGRSPLFFKL